MAAGTGRGALYPSDSVRDISKAVSRGDLSAVRAAAAELPGSPPLEEALAICLLLLDQEPERYERASVRWLGRLLL